MVDRLNNLTNEYPSISYDAFFAVMDIPKEDKDKRIELAEKLDDIYIWLFSLITLMVATGQPLDTEYLVTSVEMRLMDVADVNVEYVTEHITRIATETVETTIERRDDAYFLSDQRATEIAADEAHTLCSYEELQEAWENGYTKKTWQTMNDKRVRKSHREADGQTVPIDKMFNINGYEMATVKDTEHGAPLSEVSGCRCWVTFS